MGAVWGRVDERLHDRRVRMPEQQRGRAQAVVNICIPIDIPLARALTMRHDQGEGIGHAHVVADASGKNFLECRIELCRLGFSPYIHLTDRLSHGLLLSEGKHPASRSCRTVALALL